MPCPFTGPNMFCASPNFLCRTKKWFTYCAMQSQTFCARQKDDFHSVKLVFVPALNAVKFLGWLKKFGTGQNIFQPVKGQGISVKSTLKTLSFSVAFLENLNFMQNEENLTLLKPRLCLNIPIMFFWYFTTIFECWYATTELLLLWTCKYLV